MSLTVPQQVKQLIDQKKHILITFRADGFGDAIGSALAFFLFLAKLGKRADIVVDGFELPQGYRFLKGADTIAPHFSHLQKFIISVDVKDAGVQELSYDIADQKLRIFVTPKHGALTRDHVRTAQSDFKYDLIITVDTRDLSSLKSLYSNNTDLFYKTPMINIDHESGNEHFGQVNVVDLTATSTAEVVYDLLKKIGEEYIDADIATAILTGMIASTRSFRGDNVKPQTLAIAGHLVAQGANRDYIVHNLYRTRTLSTLKLWGNALAHLESDKTIGLVWTSMTREDFVRAGASENELQDIIDELISNSPEAKMTLLLHEHVTPEKETQIHCILHAEKGNDALLLLSPFQPTGTKKRASCLVTGKTLKQVEELIRSHIQKALKAMES
ncbi:MAG TPA: DHH family phosphoesterase [Candidatus Kapabacteria bacterium]|nr:DHH family phosphoesterase [Candidatus Kapabacteria bacterium]